MLKELNEYIINSGALNDISKYPDTKYIKVEQKEKLEIIASLKKNKINTKQASDCPANRIILDFSNSIIFINKDTAKKDAIYEVYLLQKNTYKKNQKKYIFTCFYLDDNYHPNLVSHNSSVKEDKTIWDKIHQDILALRGFMSAISN